MKGRQVVLCVAVACSGFDDKHFHGTKGRMAEVVDPFGDIDGVGGLGAGPADDVGDHRLALHVDAGRAAADQLDPHHRDCAG